MSQKPVLQTPLAKVRGLGSAKYGVHHWWVQRTTALALIVLTIWFVFSLSLLAGQPVDALREYFSAAHHLLLAILFLLAMFYHGYLGVQVVLEDYISDIFLRHTLIILTRFACFLFAGLGILGVLKLHFVA